MRSGGATRPKLGIRAGSGGEAIEEKYISMWGLVAESGVQGVDGGGVSWMGVEMTAGYGGRWRWCICTPSDILAVPAPAGFQF